jgi:hypothetical protein
MLMQRLIGKNIAVFLCEMTFLNSGMYFRRS